MPSKIPVRNAGKLAVVTPGQHLIQRVEALENASPDDDSKLEARVSAIESAIVGTTPDDDSSLEARISALEAVAGISGADILSRLVAVEAEVFPS